MIAAVVSRIMLIDDSHDLFPARGRLYIKGGCESRLSLSFSAHASHFARINIISFVVI
jgi:hypothetical protein